MSSTTITLEAAYHAYYHYRSNSCSSRGSKIDMGDAELAPWRNTFRVVNGKASDSNNEDSWNVTTGDETTMLPVNEAARDEEVKVLDVSTEESRDGHDEQDAVAKKHKRNSSLEFLRRTLETVGKYTAAHAVVPVAEPVLIAPVADATVTRRPLPSSTGIMDDGVRFHTGATEHGSLEANTGVMDTSFQFPAIAPPEQQQAPRPSNTGILDTAFQFPAVVPPQEQRVTSEPILSMAARKAGDHKRSGSFSKLLDAFGKMGNGEEKSLRQRLNQQIDDSFKLQSWKPTFTHDFPTGQGYQVHYTGGSGWR
jgi:hypothetical protein